jgi:hypothetical protein
MALKLFKTWPPVGLLLCAAMLVLTSWFRAYTAGTIMVDGHGLHGWQEVVVFVSFILSLGFFSVSYYHIWVGQNFEVPQVKFLAYLLICIFSCMLPMLSNDIFSYLVFGDAANKGADVYVNSQCTHFSTYYPYITGAWTSSTCAYGPVIVSMAMLAAWTGAGKIAVALVSYKIITSLFAVLFIEIAARISALMRSPVRCFIFIALNPVFLLQGVGQLHADLVAITFTLCAIYFLLLNRWPLVFALLALAIATKLNYVLVLPFFIIALWLQNKSWFVFWKKTIPGLVITLLSLVVVYYPFYTSILTFTTPFQFHFFKNPSKCIGEVLGDVIYFAPQIIMGHKDQLQNTVKTSAGPEMQLLISNIIVRICQVFALLGSFYLLLKFMKGERTLARWFSIYVRLLLLFLLFYMHIFNPWYLMMFLPFMWVEDQPEFMKWVLVLTCFISVQDIVCAVSRDSVVYVIVIGLTFISVMLYLYKPKRMFFTFN